MAFDSFGGYGNTRSSGRGIGAGMTSSQGGGFSQHSGGTGVDDFFQNVMGGNRGGVGSLDQYAKSQGYTGGPGGYSRSEGGRKFSTSAKQLQMRMQRDRQQQTTATGGGLAGQLMKALQFDTERQQAEANKFYDQQQQAIGQFGESLDQNVDDIKAQGEASQKAFQEMGQNLEGQGEKGIKRFEKGVTQSRGEIKDQIGKAEKFAQAAVTGLQDRTNIDASNAAFGINARVRSQTDRIGSDPNLTAAQKQDAMFQANTAGIRAQADQITNIKSTFNQQQAGLRMAQAQISGAGAQTLGAFESTVTGARVQSQAGANAMFQAGAAFRAQGESVRTAAINTAAQFELSGRQAMFEMITNAPRGIISIFAGLTSLLGALSLPGVAGAPPLQMPQ